MRLKLIQKIKIGTMLFLAIFLFISTISAHSQEMVSKTTTAWLDIKQPMCIQRSIEALSFANITNKQANEWLIFGSAENTIIVIKCVADDDTKNLVNPNVLRVLFNLTVSGPSSLSTQFTQLRNCIQEHVFTGTSSCWSQNVSISTKVLNTDKSHYSAYEPITVIFKEMPANRPDEWITIVPVGTPPSNYDQWTYLNGKKEGTLTFKGLKPGKYEVRAFFSASDSTIRALHNFTVGH